MAAVLTPEEEAAIRQKIAQAEAAYHSLMTGTMLVEVTDQNGERVKFSNSNRLNLYAYIGQLKALLPGATPFGSAPAAFYF
jgi:hypothetical protein